LLPYLLKAGEKALEEVAKKFGADTWDLAKALWGKLHQRIEAIPAAQEAVQHVAAMPNDEDIQAALRLQLKKVLAEDGALAQEVKQLCETRKQGGITIITAGERSMAARRIEGSSMITGDLIVIGR
jgi:hypothetical protein